MLYDFNTPVIRFASYSNSHKENKLYSLTSTLKEEADVKEQHRIKKLFNSIEKNDVVLTKRKILRIKNINAIDSNFDTALIKAVKLRYNSELDKEKNLEIIHLLLQANADPNLAITSKECRSDFFDPSVLSCALEKSDKKLAMLLLEYGAEKQYAYCPNVNILQEQKFDTLEQKTYEYALNAIKIKSPLFILSVQESYSSNDFPKEIVQNILTCIPKVKNAYQQKIEETKKIHKEKSQSLYFEGNNNNPYGQVGLY